MSIHFCVTINSFKANTIVILVRFDDIGGLEILESGCCDTASGLYRF